jgi:hypothetical protein
MTDRHRQPARNPPPEDKQFDPLLKTSGRVGTAGLSLLGLAAAFILGIVFYALNAPDEPMVASDVESPAAATPRPGPPTAPDTGGQGG